MALTLVVFAGFYTTPRHTVHYASTLAQALHGPLVLLHVNRASMFDPYALMAERYHQNELNRQMDTAAALHRLAGELPNSPIRSSPVWLPPINRWRASTGSPLLMLLTQKR